MVTRTAGQAPGVVHRADPAGSPGLSPRRLPDMDALYSRLTKADETDDAAALARLAWELYGLVGSLAADRDALRADLHQVLAANLAANLAAAHRQAS